MRFIFHSQDWQKLSVLSGCKAVAALTLLVLKETATATLQTSTATSSEAQYAHKLQPDTSASINLPCRILHICSRLCITRTSTAIL